MADDMVLHATGYTGTQAAYLGVFELQAGGMVRGRPTYKKLGEEEVYLFYTTGGKWVVGPDTSKNTAWWKVTSTARTPDAITEVWQVHDGRTWVDVHAATIVKRSAFEAEVASTARAFGDVALQANGYTGMNAGILGVFKLQAKVVQGRPTYKKQEKKEFLFYSAGGSWMVGNDTSKNAGWWMVKSGAITPGAITEVWQIYDGSAFVDVRAAKIVKRAAFEAAEAKVAATVAATVAAVAMATAPPTGAVVLHADGYTGVQAAYLGVFELQAKVVQGRPTYKKRGVEVFLFYSTTGKWMVGPDTSKAAGRWKAASTKRMPLGISSWQVYAGEWVDYDGSVEIMPLTSFQKRVSERVHAELDMEFALRAEKISDKNFTNAFLGVFTYYAPGPFVNYRPTYRRCISEAVSEEVSAEVIQAVGEEVREKFVYLFYTVDGSWMVGPDPRDNKTGVWRVYSGAITPKTLIGSPPAPWQVLRGGTDWVDQVAEIVPRSVFDKAVYVAASADGIQVVLCIDEGDGELRAIYKFELQKEVVHNGRPTYKTIGFPDQRQWEQVRTALRAYEELHGDLQVPLAFVVPPEAPWPEEAWGMELGSRVNDIRSGAHSVLCHPQRLADLEALGFVWEHPPLPAAIALPDWRLAAATPHADTRVGHPSPVLGQYLFYVNNHWVVGPDMAKAGYLWRVESFARKPLAITEEWQLFDGAEWRNHVIRPTMVSATEFAAYAIVRVTSSDEDEDDDGADEMAHMSHDYVDAIRTIVFRAEFLTSILADGWRPSKRGWKWADHKAAWSYGVSAKPYLLIEHHGTDMHFTVHSREDVRAAAIHFRRNGRVDEHTKKRVGNNILAMLLPYNWQGSHDDTEISTTLLLRWVKPGKANKSLSRRGAVAPGSHIGNGDATPNAKILANPTEAGAILAVVTAIMAGSGGLSQGYIRTALQTMLHLRTPLPGLKF